MTDEQLPISKRAVKVGQIIESRCLAQPGKWAVYLTAETDGTFTMEIQRVKSRTVFKKKVDPGT